MLNATLTRSAYTSPDLAAEIVATMNEPFAVLDSSLRLVAASPAFFLRFSLDSARTVGLCLFDWGGGEWDTATSRRIFEEIAPGREMVDLHTLEVRSPGTLRPRVRLSVRPVREGYNEIAAYLVTFAEVERSAASPANRLLGRFRRRSADLIAVAEASSGRLLIADGAARELTGFSTGELEGMSVQSLIHPEERKAITVEIARLCEDEPHARLTFRIRHRDGRSLWVEALCDFWSEDGHPPLVHLSARDVSDRKRAEESLRWLGRQVKLILDSAPDGIFGVDPRGYITFINPSAARLLGYRVSDLLGHNYRELFDGQPSNEDSADAVEQTLADGLGRDVRETELRCGDGGSIAVELSCRVARERGEVSGAVVTFRGIGERKRAEAAAHRAQWLAGVGETTIAVRHEINNPLTTLLAEARLLEMGGNSREEVEQMVGVICDESRRIADLIRRLTECQNAPAIRIDGGLRMLDLRAPE